METAGFLNEKIQTKARTKTPYSSHQIKMLMEMVAG